jgi:hypothetical protein
MNRVLAVLFNKCWTAGKVPTRWGIARVKMLHNRDSKGKPERSSSVSHWGSETSRGIRWAAVFWRKTHPLAGELSHHWVCSAVRPF